MPSVDGISVEVHDQAVTDMLRRLTSAGRDASEAMGAIGAALLSNVGQRSVQGQMDPDRRPWAPLAPSTIKSRRRGRDGVHILRDTGVMMGSLNAHSGRDFVTVGFGVEYAAYHEFGTRKIPRRGLLLSDPEAGVFSAEDRASITGIIRTFLETA
jgi:phage virion morphogenesis protein